MNIVRTNIPYTYAVLKRDMEEMKKWYPFLEVGTAGKSVLGKDLYYLKLGNGPNEVFYNGAHHALEWITAPLLMKFIENLARAYKGGSSIGGYPAEEILCKSAIYVVPMVNPDGVDLVLEGLQKDHPYYEKLLEWNGGRTDFSKVWQANIRGVDLNHNYDASWQESKEAELKLGINGPGPTRYSGPYPESEPESKAVADFTRSHDFKLVLAYHSQGEVIYWNYRNMAPPSALEIGRLLSEASGYPLDEVYGIAAYGGYKDWFIEKFKRPGYTVEVGLGKNPLPISQFPKIYQDNELLLLLAAVSAEKAEG